MALKFYDSPFHVTHDNETASKMATEMDLSIMQHQPKRQRSMKMVTKEDVEKAKDRAVHAAEDAADWRVRYAAAWEARYAAAKAEAEAEDEAQAAWVDYQKLKEAFENGN